LFYPIHISIFTAIIATIIETIPIYNLDNFAIPLITGISLYYLKYIF